MSIRCITVLLVALVASAAPALDRAPIHLGTPLMYGWVPDNHPVLRGLIVLNGFPMDNRWNEVCRLWGFGLVRINTDGYPREPDDNARALVHAIRTLAERSGHSELVHVPFVPIGYSRYAPSAAFFTARFPGRVLGHISGNNVRGAEFSPRRASDALVWEQTPSHWLGCEWENIFSGGDKRTLVYNWRRPPTTLQMAGMTWRVYHDPGDYSDLAFTFVDQLIATRIPADWNPRHGPAELLPVDRSQGWLGSHAGWSVPVEEIFATDNENAHIAPYADFTADRHDASWLLNETMAWVWRAYNSRYPRVRIIAPSHAAVVIHESDNIPPVLHAEHGLRAGTEGTVTIRCWTDGVARVELFANTLSLGATETFTGGDAPLGGTRDAEATLTVRWPERGLYALMVRYVTDDGQVGWSNPAPVVVWGADEEL